MKITVQGKQVISTGSWEINITDGDIFAEDLAKNIEKEGKMEEQTKEIDLDLNIDINNLGFECLDQPRRFMKWGRIYAEAIKERDLAKRQLSVIRSNINQDIRMRPDAYGLDKTTEGAVAAVLESVKEVDEAEKNVIQHQYAVNIFSSAKEAFDQRRSMIERAIQLYTDGYWSQPRIPTASTETVKQMVDSGTDSLKAQLKLRMQKK